MSDFAVSFDSVTVATTPGHILAAFTSIDIMCDVTLSDSVDTNTTIAYQWLGPLLLSTGSNYTITGNNLRINQLMMVRDNGRTITCVATAMTESQSQDVVQNTASNSTQLAVVGENSITIVCMSSCVFSLTATNNVLLSNLHVALSDDLFTPDIIIPGVPTAGDNFNIICRLAGVVERLVGTPIVILSFNNPPGGSPGDQSPDGSAYIIPRIFNPGITNDVGSYICLSVVRPSSGGLFGGTASKNLQIRSKCQHMVLCNVACTCIFCLYTT